MPNSADHFDEAFAPHSRHKHLIFKSYFEAWLRKLTLRPEGGDRLCVIDACAGAGHDAAGNPGSPLIAARAAGAAVGQFREQFQRDIRIDVIAIEKEPKHFKELALYLSTFPDSVRPIQGTLEQHQDELERDLGETPTLYFIDPFGLAPLKAQVVRRALHGAKNEVFLLFADQAALRHFGVIQAEETGAMRKLRAHVEAPPSLFPELDELERQPLVAKAARSEAALETTRDNAIEILRAAFGGMEWLKDLERTPAPLRRAAFLTLYERLLMDCGATRVLEIPMLNEDGYKVYSLIHATKSGNGYATMKAAVCYALRNSPLPAEVAAQMQESLRVDLSPIVTMLRTRFAERRVHWAVDKLDKERTSLKKVVLEDSPMFPSQVPELQTALKRFRVPGRAIEYQFPRD